MLRSSKRRSATAMWRYLYKSQSQKHYRLWKRKFLRSKMCQNSRFQPSSRSWISISFSLSFSTTFSKGIRSYFQALVMPIKISKNLCRGLGNFWFSLLWESISHKEMSWEWNFHRVIIWSITENSIILLSWATWMIISPLRNFSQCRTCRNSTNMWATFSLSSILLLWSWVQLQSLNLSTARCPWKSAMI